MMDGVTVVDHVLLQQLVSILRVGTPHGSFRQTLDDAGMILAYEAMRGLRTGDRGRDAAWAAASAADRS
jgi:uracil phosphoribosyltransferase